MRYLFFISFVLFLYSCETSTVDGYYDVFFFPCECNEAPIDNGYIRVYKNIDTAGNPSSMVEYVQVDSEYAINDENNGIYYSYNVSLEKGTYYAQVHSDISDKSQVHEFKVKNGSNHITLAACN